MNIPELTAIASVYKKNTYYDFDDKCTAFDFIEVPELLLNQITVEGETIEHTSLNIFIEPQPYYNDFDENFNLIEKGAVAVKVATNVSEYLYVYNRGAILALEEGLMDQASDPMIKVATVIGKLMLKSSLKKLKKDHPNSGISKLVDLIYPESFKSIIKRELAEINSTLTKLDKDVNSLLLMPYQDKYVITLDFFNEKYLEFAKIVENSDINDLKEYKKFLKDHIHTLDGNTAAILDKLTVNALNSCSYYARQMFELYMRNTILALVLKIEEYKLAKFLQEGNTTLKLLKVSYEKQLRHAKSFVPQAIKDLIAGRLSKITFKDKTNYKTIVFVKTLVSYELKYSDSFSSKYDEDFLKTSKEDSSASASLLSAANITALEFGASIGEYSWRQPKLANKYKKRKAQITTALNNYSKENWEPVKEIFDNAITDISELEWKKS